MSSCLLIWFSNFPTKRKWYIWLFFGCLVRGQRFSLYSHSRWVPCDGSVDRRRLGKLNLQHPNTRWSATGSCRFLASEQQTTTRANRAWDVWNSFSHIHSETVSGTFYIVNAWWASWSGRRFVRYATIKRKYRRDFFFFSLWCWLNEW